MCMDSCMLSFSVLELKDSSSLFMLVYFNKIFLHIKLKLGLGLRLRFPSTWSRLYLIKCLPILSFYIDRMCVRIYRNIKLRKFTFFFYHWIAIINKIRSSSSNLFVWFLSYIKAIFFPKKACKGATGGVDSQLKLNPISPPPPKDQVRLKLEKCTSQAQVGRVMQINKIKIWVESVGLYNRIM